MFYKPTSYGSGRSGSLQILILVEGSQLYTQNTIAVQCTRRIPQMYTQNTKAVYLEYHKAVHLEYYSCTPRILQLYVHLEYHSCTPRITQLYTYITQLYTQNTIDTHLEYHSSTSKILQLYTSNTIIAHIKYGNAVHLEYGICKLP